MIKIFLIIMFLIACTSCLHVNLYHCPTVNHRYKKMDYRDRKHLTRPTNKYKRREPNTLEQEGLGADFDYKAK